MSQLAIALQTWSGDVAVAIELTKLICDIEPEKRNDIEFLISARRGVGEVEIAEMYRLANLKFHNVQIIRGQRFGEGWPLGSNDLWQETMMRVSQLSKNKRIQSTGVLTFEPDIIPLRPDWLTVLSAEWSTVRQAMDGIPMVIGHAHGNPPDHINGNAIFHTRILKYHQELNGSDSRAGWDTYHGELLLRIGVDTPLIDQRYNETGMTYEGLQGLRKQGCIPAFLHGIKGMQPIQWVRQMIADGTLSERKT